MNGNNNYYLVSCEKFKLSLEVEVYFKCFYSNGLQQIERTYIYGQDIPTIIYDNE